ncbi:MAG: pyridoxine 5'-phosphate synthase [Bacteroidales bacterium]|jgi:pyridoxine 5-phosphate synthase|nr:pyridoxine 5'-phosphate synthase [Bacteroidales bacterium]
MTKLSVNINKIATLRNARGGNLPNLIQVAGDIEKFGAQGITVHPRPDGRHIRYEDVRNLKKIVTTEFNIEGYPSKDFIDLVMEVKPHQVTLVPDAPDAITSNNGWDTVKFQEFLFEICQNFRKAGIRTSIFVNPEVEIVRNAKSCGTDRIELYTESYATNYPVNPKAAIKDYLLAAEEAVKQELGLNAGHDLNLHNLNYFAKTIPQLLEVSIGHALISDALYFGMEKTVRRYLEELR